MRFINVAILVVSMFISGLLQAQTKHPDDVRSSIQQHLDAYETLKQENIEARYKEMLRTHQSNSDDVLNTFKVVSSIWSDIAAKAKNPEIYNLIKESSPAFISAVKAAREKTTNKNINAVAESAEKSGAALKRAYDRYVNNVPEVKERAQEINTNTDLFYTASEKYVKYWTGEFKDVSDKNQVIDIIRTKVGEAVNPELKAARAKLMDLETEKKKLVEQEKRLLDELANLGNTDADKRRRREISNELDNIDTSIHDDDIEFLRFSVEEYESMLGSVGA